MKKKFSIILAVILLLASMLNAAAVFADEEEKGFISFYWSLGDGSVLNGITFEFEPDYAVRYYASDECPEFLDDGSWSDPFTYEVKDESGAVLSPDESGVYSLAKGSYTLTWANLEEIKEQLKTWEYYDKNEYEFPENDSISFSVDGEKRKVSFYIFPSSTINIEKDSEYYFDPSNLWILQLNGVSSKDYSAFYRLINKAYKFDVMDRSGHILTGEELAKPLKEGSYKLIWNNPEEIKAIVESSDDEVISKYAVKLPEEPLTSIFTITSKEEKPTEQLWFFEFYGRNEGESLPTARDLIFFSDIEMEDKESYPECIDNVVIEYYDETGRKLEEDETVGGMAAGVYTAKWVNYNEFLAMDEEQGWGIQEKYKTDVYFGDECPTCICEFYQVENDMLGSVFGNGNLTIVFGFSTVICIAIIIALVIKIKKTNVN